MHYYEAMKRDMKLVREILEQVERSIDRRGYIEDPKGYTRKDVNNHLEMMHQAGLIGDFSTANKPENKTSVGSITWAGYDLLESLREQDPL